MQAAHERNVDGCRACPFQVSQQQQMSESSIVAKNQLEDVAADQVRILSHISVEHPPNP